jgi:hypothetical protein
MPSEAGSVEKVLKNSGSPVDPPTTRINFDRNAPESARVHSVDAPSALLSLVWWCSGARLTAPLHTPLLVPAPNVNEHRFEEIINGREYRIEVSNVGTNKWRAQIARVPGGSAATMPFYGSTPVEAAGQLSRWLCLAHGQVRHQL